MKNRNFTLTLFALTLSIGLFAQTDVRIFHINPKIHADVKTSGVVTAFVDGGFYIQDSQGDGDNATCDAIFVATSDSTFSLGDEVEIVASVNSDKKLTNIRNIRKVAENKAVAATKLIFPQDNLSNHIGEKVQFNQTLVVTNTYYWASYGQIVLSSQRLTSATEVAKPGSSDYSAIRNANSKNKLYVVDATQSSSPFADENGTLRTGYCVDNLQGTLVSANKLQVTETPNWYGNQRPTTHNNIGNYNVKVCATNLEYYIRSKFDGNYGPANLTEANRQNAKIVKGLRAIDADIYGLLEIQQGQEAIAYLCQSLNEAAGSDIYAYVSDITNLYQTYTKVGFIYRKDRIKTKGSLTFDNTKTMYRKAIQAFTLISNNESFMLSLNHFKAKSGSGTGDDADQGDGQGGFNATRVAEAEAVLRRCDAQYTDEDVLVMGDLNAHSMEDPVQAFVNAGYTNLLKAYHGNSEYSYSYNGEVGLLDHALANESMRQQVSGVTSFHVNCDEPAKFEYTQAGTENIMYRYSDHDPIIVGLHLGDYETALPEISTTNPEVETNDENRFPIVYYDYFYIVNAENLEAQIFDLSGRMLKKQRLTSDREFFSISDLGISNGLLLVRLTNPEKSNFEPIILKVIVP